MTIKVVAEEIERFLATREPEVLCITGPWGAGKTYAWVHYFRNAKTVALEDYAYVSLFGQNSIEDVRSSIFENTELAKPTSPKNSAIAIKEKGERVWRHVTKYRKLASSFFPDGTVAITERLLFASLKPLIVCIDDLERAGDGLSKRDVLGLVTQLKEQKKCKVVLLLNSAALGTDEEDFNRQTEKVVDTIISFEPSPEEAAKIGIGKGVPHEDLLRDYCTKLGIKNIRVVRRVETACRRLQELLGKYDERVLKQAMQAAALFTFSRYQPDIAPTEAFIKGYNRVPTDESEKDEHATWRNLLADYGFLSVDQLDLAVAHGVQSGHFSVDLLTQQAEQMQAALQLQDKDDSFQKAWNRYHYSFGNDQDDVLDAMADAFKKSVASITPLNASSTVQFFKELGRSDEALELANYYIANRHEQQEFWDLEESIFGAEVKDPDVRQLFQQKYDSFSAPLEEPASILLRINKQSGWNPRDIERLAEVTEDEFFKMFKTPHGKDLTRITAEALRFKARGAPGTPEHTIYERANAALEKIAGESAINARRVKWHRTR